MTDSLLKGLVQNTFDNPLPDGGAAVFPVLGRHGELIVTSMHGAAFVGNLRKRVFHYDRTAITIPVINSNLVSVFSLWNPPSSGVIAELLETQLDQVLATTVVNTFGWYQQNGSAANAATFTTVATALSGRVGETANNKVLPYSALTHSGTPARAEVIGSHGAVTNAQGIRKEHGGRIIIPPGTILSLATSTAAATTSGMAAKVSWAEWPFTV